MNSVSNKQLGNRFEREFCQLLSDAGYWVLNVPMSQAGQPADVIAVKNDLAFLIDCKVCSGNGFQLSRIEENQILAMTLWKACGNNHAWFAIKMHSGEIRMLSSDAAKVHKQYHAKMSDADLKSVAIEIKDWLRLYDYQDF